TLDSAAREHVEHAEHAARLLLERLPEGFGIDSRKRDIGAEAINEESAQREPDALLEILCLGEGCEIKIGCQLFCSRCHANSPLGHALPRRPTGTCGASRFAEVSR